MTVCATVARRSPLGVGVCIYARTRLKARAWRTNPYNNEIMLGMIAMNGSGNTTKIVLGDEALYVPFVISVFGLMGNLLTFMTIVLTDLKKNYVNKYILVLLGSDSLVLLNVFMRMFDNLDTVNFGLCVFVRYTWNTAIYVSNFAIISLTIERFFAIVYPLQHLRFSGLNRFNHLFALRRTAHDFASIQFSTSKAFKCNYDTESRYVDVLFHFPRILFQFVLTFVVVLGVNTFIFIKLRSRYVIIGETGPGEMRSTNVLLAVVPVIYIFFQTNKGTYFFLGHHYCPAFRKEFCRKWLRRRATCRQRIHPVTTRRDEDFE
uniref:G-protein coupled receptors family 1 profile domain-containing protein n=1 Tax=Globodera rostochiensis TaxID=31243 RepID=A0A914HZQ5_GLORO